MHPEFWHERWSSSRIRFHQPVVNRYLQTYGGRFPPGKVLVPLCGKSLDLQWLEDRGHDVLGVELSPIACAAFFEERGRTLKKAESVHFTKFSDGKTTLWCGDFFKLDPAECADVTSIYDQACLIAFPSEMRSRYVKHLQYLFPSTRPVPMLLNTIEYPQALMEGPPFSVSQVDVERYFGPFITVLESNEVSPTRYEKLSRIIEKSYWIEHGRV